MHFKAGSREAKATLEIGDKKYSVKAPTVAQSVQIAKALDELKEDPMAQSEAMKSYICELGSIPRADLDSVENDIFVELFWHVVTPKKN